MKIKKERKKRRKKTPIHTQMDWVIELKDPVELETLIWQNPDQPETLFGPQFFLLGRDGCGFCRTFFPRFRDLGNDLARDPDTRLPLWIVKSPHLNSYILKEHPEYFAQEKRTVPALLLRLPADEESLQEITDRFRFIYEKCATRDDTLNLVIKEWSEWIHALPEPRLVLIDSSNGRQEDRLREILALLLLNPNFLPPAPPREICNLDWWRDQLHRLIFPTVSGDPPSVRPVAWHHPKLNHQHQKRPPTPTNPTSHTRFPLRSVW